MTVLLTGGTGFLGSHIAELLSRDGIKVRAIIRTTSDTALLRQLANVELVNVSLSDKSALAQAVRGVDAVINSAALIKAVNKDQFMQVNVGATENLLEAVIKSGVKLQRFVLISSIAAVGPNAPGEILSSNCKTDPVTWYGRSKLASERMAHKYIEQVPVTILRPVSLYGPRDKGSLTIFRCIKSGILPRCGSLERRLMFLHGKDCARACIRAIDADVPSGTAYFLDDGNVYTWRTVLSAIEEAMGTKAFVRFSIPRGIIGTVAAGLEVYGKITNKATMLTRDKMHELYGEFATDSSDTRQALGWTPQIKLEDGLRETVHWYRENRWL